MSGASGARRATVVARNLHRESENRIHDDDVARQYGFRGGLVPGVTVYAYLARLPTARWGLDWVERGTMAVRFRRPAYDGDTLDLVLGGDGMLGAAGPDGEQCAVGVASLPGAGAPPPPDPAAFPETPLPAPRTPARPEALASLGALGSMEVDFRADKVAAFLDAIGEPAALYREHGVAHPGWLLQWANWILVANVALGPWIHTASVVTHHGLVGDGDRLSIHGRVAALGERNGNDLVDLDLLLVANGDSPVMSVRHSAIYRIGRAGR